MSAVLNAVLPLYLAAVNGLLFVLMAWDKAAAKRKKRRIPERRLLLLCLAGGSLGGCLGMRVFRHKTRHRVFRWGFPLILLLHTALALGYMRP